MLIKAAINGGRTKAEHPAIPVTPEELVSDVLECLNAGARAIHLHVRSSTGTESLMPEDIARTLQALKSAAPQAPIGVTTGAWIVPEPSERFQQVAAWEVQPDFASVNFSEQGAVELAQLLLARGVGVEAGLCDPLAAESFLRSGLAPRCLRVLIEPQEQGLEEALNVVNQIEAVLARGAVEPTRVLHGTEATTWPMLEEALTRGYGVRVGFEDTLILPDGTAARANAELVTEAVRRSKYRPKIL